MAIDISSLILDTRESLLADVDESYLTDGQLMQDLSNAYTIISNIAVEDADESLVTVATQNYGAYIAYVNYTNVVEMQKGEIPHVAYIKISTMRSIARTAMQLISSVPIREDLTIDEKVYKNVPGVGYAFAKTILDTE